MTRAEHLAWAKERALAYVDMSLLPMAVASMTSDLSKHEAFGGEIYRGLIAAGVAEAMSGDSNRVRHWIEGFG